MPNILVVDDHPLFREALGDSLRQAIPDTTVIEAHSIEGAIEAIQANADIDLVLLDLNLPDTSGFGGLLTIRTRFPKTIGASSPRRSVTAWSVSSRSRPRNPC